MNDSQNIDETTFETEFKINIFHEMLQNFFKLNIYVVILGINTI